MKLSLKTLLLLVIVAAVFASCKKSVPKQAKFIPKDATYVISLSPRNLAEKLAKSNFKLDSVLAFPTEGLNDSSLSKFKNMATDIKDAGIDFKEDLYAFVKTGGSMMGGQTVSFALIGITADASKFEAFVKKHAPQATIKKDAKYSYAALGDDFVAGWNSDVIIISAVTGGKDSPGTYSTGEGTLSQLQLTKLYELKEAESVAAIAEYRELAKEKADATMWSNYSSVIETVPMIGMTKAADLLKEYYQASTFNFEDGKIVGAGKAYNSKALEEILKKHENKTVDMDMVTKYPSNAIDGFMAFSFDMGILADILKFSGFEGQANQFLGQLGITAEDITKAIKGDFAVIVSDFSVVEKENPYYPAAKSKEPEVKVIFNTKVGDKASFEKVMNAFAGKGMVEKTGNGYALKGVPPGVALSIDDKNIIYSTDSTLLQQYKAGSGKATLPDDVKSGSGKYMNMYFDIARILQGVPVDSAMGEDGKAVLDKAKATFKDVKATSEHVSDKVSASLVEIRMVDEKKNSLAALAEFFTEVAKVAKKHMKTDGIEPPVIVPDSSLVPPPPPAAE
ncbi:DUF4836 family protein [Foetidibacter luteolus]|uniref:DUF4836 family protein n=1 Tax=Foetidibacter luteolus TaxID=2608880 RepID=UPI00129B759B|nr:DUF4836 family protein [Foetidibacter luteolus]